MLSIRSNKFLIKKRFYLVAISCLLIQSCANTDIGRNLSESFNYKTSDSEINVSNSSIKNKKLSSKLDAVDVKPDKDLNLEGKNIRKNIKAKKLNKRPPSFIPRPYRITIKLSGANPSAPAETVTNALRKAGVEFEVERIERAENNNYDQVRTIRGGSNL